MNYKLKAKLCSAEKLKLMTATLVADGKENEGAVQCNWKPIASLRGRAGTGGKVSYFCV